MTLQEAEFTVHEFKKVTVIQSAEVVPNIDGDYSVLVTAIFRDLSIAAKALGIARAEEDFGNMAYATLGESNVPVLCSRETWQAWWDANPGGKIVKREQSGDVVTEIIFTGCSSKLDSADGPPKLWTVRAHNTKTGRSAGIGTFATLEEAVAFLETTKGPHSGK